MAWAVSKLLLAVMLAAAQDIPESQLQIEKGGRYVFPLAFQGTWAPTLAKCDAEEAITITEDRLYGYESTAVIIISVGIIHQTTPQGVAAYSTTNLVGQRAETEVGIGKLRISRAGEKLYTSNAEIIGEDEHWTNSNVRCPAS